MRLPRVHWGLIARYAFGFVTGRPLVPRDVKVLRATRACLTAASVPFEVDGDLCGMLPVELGVQPGVLRVVAPD